MPEDNAEMIQLLEQELARLKTPAEQVQQTQQVAQPVAPEFKLTVGGQTLSFANQSQLDNHVAQMQSHYAAQAQAEATRLAAQQQQSQQQQPILPTANINEYADLLVKDPAAALAYSLDARMGMKNSPDVIKGAIVEVLKHQQELLELRNEIKEEKWQREAERWYDRNPDWEHNRDKAPELLNIMASLKLSHDYQGLDAAYSHGLRQGVFTAAPVENQQSQQLNAPARFTPPRIGRTSNTGVPDAFRQAEALDADKLEQLIRRLESGQGF